MSAPFLIYNASAGAGKTYRLVRHYLKLCLQSREPMAFMSILAITFTNKAANEMKNRLIQQLQVLERFPNLKEKELDYCYELAKEMGIEAEELKYRAGKSLAAILHNYSGFSVSTIDRFTNRLIRSFSKDLNLNSNYQVEMKSDLILEEAVDRVLDELHQDSPFAQILSRYIKAQLADDKSPDARRALNDLAKELLKERSIEPIEQLQKLSPQEFNDLERSLRNRLDQIRKEYKELAQSLIELMETQGVVGAAFRSHHIVGQIQAIAKGEFRTFSPAISTALEEGPKGLIPKKSKPETPRLLANLDQISEGVFALKHFYEQHIEAYFLLEMCIPRIPAMAVLAEIDLKLQEVKEESNRLPIGEFNKIISQELRRQPAPFIFEKMGERYQHFFIDEFQDTSTLQWYNMVPLINNALAEKPSSALIVGDAKQSIYRFRGGELQLFVDLFQDREGSNKLGDQTLYERETETLGSNYRSLKNIVDFNNRFFEGAANYLGTNEHQGLYKAAKQIPAAGGGGQVGLHVLNRDNFKEEQLELLIELLNRCFECGFKQKDLCLLVSKNSNGQEAAEFLLAEQKRIHTPEQKALKILSVDSLVVGASPEVRALISFLSMVEQERDYANRKDWILYAHQSFDKSNSETFNYLSHLKDLELSEVLKFLEANSDDFQARTWLSQDLIQQLYSLAKAFKMPWQTDPYLQFFFDQAQEYLQNQKPLSQEFLNWWEEHGAQESVSLPDSLDAVQIMSIHKSKGLEFPVVICLNVDGALDEGMHRNTGWIDLQNLEGLEFASLPYGFINFKKAVAPERQAIYQNFYEAERNKVLLDQLNRYYVAFTRAEQELHILCPSPVKNPGNHIESQLQKFFAAEGNGSYYIGEANPPLSENISSKAYLADGFSAVDWFGKIETVSTAPKHWQEKEVSESTWGKQVHQLLAHLKHPKDLASVIQKAQREAWFQEEEIERLEKQIQQLCRLPELKPLFDEKVTVYNERSLVLPGGTQRIPDRLVEFDGNWYIADYKSGIARPEHKQQVNEYRQLMEQAGFHVARLYLIYLNAEELSLETWS